MSGRPLVVLLLIGVLLLPVGLVGLYMARGGGGPRPLIMPAPAAVTLDQPAQWVEGLREAAVERDPHTSMATLEAFVVDRVSAKVTELGDNTPVRLTGEGPAAAVAGVLRERLGTRWGARVSADAPSGLSASAASPAEPPVASPVPYPAESPVGAVGPERPVQLATTVAVSWRNLNRAAVPWWPTAVKSGELVVYIAGPKGDATVLAKLDEKPWLSTAPAAAGLPDYAVVTVGEPVTSSAEAGELVRRLSVDTLVRRLDARAGSMPGGARVADGELRLQAEQAVIGGGAVVDQCVVRVQRPYGEVFYAANLLDTRPDRIEPLARAAVVNQQSHQRTVAGVLVALPGMMLVLGVVYLGLNALTRGYFRTHLRAAALTAVAVLVLIAVMIVLG